MLDGAEAGAAVKANAYGLGVVAVANALWDAGCRHFFVASLAEGVEIRRELNGAQIYVFNGAMPGTVDELIEHDLIPLVISLAQLDLWRNGALENNRELAVGLHFDTGMGRTGITRVESQVLLDRPDLLAGLNVCHVMSHMACADDRTSTQPEQQLNGFLEIAKHFSDAPASLSNSAGVFRSRDFHFDIVRPGISIYGGQPIVNEANPMEQTVVLEAPIVQFKDVAPRAKVGYGATYEVTKPERHATVLVGYADGYLRSQSNSGKLSIGGHICRIVGRVSMDLTIIDVSGVPDAQIYLGAPVEVIGDDRPIDDVAADAGTIANELLTDLGTRYTLIYTDD